MYYNQILFNITGFPIQKNNKMACLTQTLKHTGLKDFDFATPISHQKSNSHNKYKNNSTREQYTESYQNKLPVNLFYSAAQYNKMLITNGKSLRRRSQPQVQGYITNLQFINQPIFQSCQKKKQTLREKQRKQQYNNNNSDRKKNNSSIKQCICCCCDKYCKICAKQQNKNKHHYKSVSHKKVTQQQLQKTLQKLSSLPLKKDKKKNKKKIITSQANINNYQNGFDKSQKKVINSQKQCSSSYLSHKSFHIDNLISNSLMQLENLKKQKKLKKFEEKRRKYQQNRYQMEIRQRNKVYMQRPKSQHKMTKKQQMLKIAQQRQRKTRQFWENNRELAAREQERYKLLKLKQIQLERKSKSAGHSNVHTRYTPEQIEALRLRHEKEAKQKINKQLKEKSLKKKNIDNHLQKLQFHRRAHIQNCQKKKFQPTPQMIDEAFKNIIEQPKPIINNGKVNMKKIKN